MPEQRSVPSKDFPNVWQMHLYAVLRFVIFGRQQFEFPRRSQFVDG